MNSDARPGTPVACPNIPTIDSFGCTSMRNLSLCGKYVCRKKITGVDLVCETAKPRGAAKRSSRMWLGLMVGERRWISLLLAVFPLKTNLKSD